MSAAISLVYPILGDWILFKLFIARNDFLGRSSLARTATSGYGSTLESGGLRKFSLMCETRELLHTGVRGSVATRWLVGKVSGHETGTHTTLDG